MGIGAGRKKLSNEQKMLRGTDQPCRMTNEVGLNKITTLPRSGLKGTSKKIFELVSTELIHKNLLELVGLDLVVAYAREMGLYHDMMRDVGKEGITSIVVTKNGTSTVINPKRKVAESALANAKAIAVEFGFTPASRSRVSNLVTNENAKDDFTDFEEIK